MLRLIDRSATEFPREWVRCYEWIEPALDGTHNIFDVYDRLLSSGAQLWAGDVSAGVTEVVKYPRQRVLNLWLAGGDMTELVGSFPLIKQYAKDLHCQRLTIQGRRGWLRALGGFTEFNTTMGMDL